MQGVKVNISREDFVGVIEAEGGVITRIAERLKCHRAVIYRLIKDHEISPEFLEQCRETVVDYAESALIDILQDRDHRTAGPRVTAAIWTTKTKGRHRGWTEKTQDTDAAKELAELIIRKLGGVE